MSAILVLVDVQKEYVTPGRPFCLETLGPSLENLRKLQAHARKEGWRVVHIKHQQNSEYFGYGSPYAEFIEGFEPLEGELVMEKSDFSCFSSPEFQALTDRLRNREMIIAGYSAANCCLSTMVSAHHRGFEFTFVTDATCAKSTKRFGEQDMKEHIVDIISAYGNLATTEEILHRVYEEE